MTFAEVVSDMMFAGKTLQEIASYDRVQMFHVLFRKRDKFGKLVRHEESLPDWVEVDERGMRRVGKPVALAILYKKVRMYQGLTEEQAEQRWNSFKEQNPKMGRGGLPAERRERRKRESKVTVEKA